ncbi:MAG: hypothetical protein F4077_06730 [Gammaproteobacteria bacterium]|nr:hypothetical protein [Gammaproteobacteria bacterium]
MEKAKEQLIVGFVQVLQNSSELGGNPYLARLRPIVCEVSREGDEQIANLIQSMRRLLQDEDMGLDGQKTETFIQKLGEAHFYVVCKKRGISLEKLPVGNKQTADFRSKNANDVCFEVKTPSVNRGMYRICESIEQSFYGAADLERLLNEGERVAITTQTITSYKEIDYSKRLTGVICELHAKLKQNIKLGQFSKKPTYLVCNLMMLPIYGSPLDVLRPVYPSKCCSNHMCSVSGLLWMVAFSKPGMMVFSEPEFEGKSGIEGQIDMKGILVDSDYKDVFGLVFVVYASDQKPCVVALVRSDEDLVSPIRKLVDTRWNDSGDTNGYAIRS